jgi:hypothetical protein
VTAAEAVGLYKMHAKRLTPFDGFQYWVAGSLPVWGTTLSPSLASLPVAVAAAGAAAPATFRITVQGRFFKGDVYEMNFRDVNNMSMRVSALVTETTNLIINRGLVFDLAGALWAFAHAATTISITSVTANLLMWQRVCLKKICGLSASGDFRDRGLSPTLQGSLVRFDFTMDSYVFSVPTKDKPSFERVELLQGPLSAIPARVFLGAASTTSMHIDGAHWLGVANFWNGKDYLVPSTLLNLDSDSGSDSMQHVWSRGARPWATGEVSERPAVNFSTMLVLASYLSPSLLIPWKPPPLSMLDTNNTVELNSVTGSSLGVSAVKVLNIRGCQVLEYLRQASWKVLKYLSQASWLRYFST